MHAVQTAQAPTPAGHYAQGIVHQGLVYVAGQVPQHPATGEPETGGIEAQTELALRNVEAVLHAAGSSLDRVLSMTVYITDMALWAQVNGVFARMMGAHRPARAIIPIGPLAKGYMIEIQAIGVVS